MDFEVTEHAKERINERDISLEWIERTFIIVITAYFDRSLKGKL